MADDRASRPRGPLPNTYWDHLPYPPLALQDTDEYTARAVANITRISDWLRRLDVANHSYDFKTLSEMSDEVDDITRRMSQISTWLHNTQIDLNDLRGVARGWREDQERKNRDTRG
jgi:hypothetical protein